MIWSWWCFMWFMVGGAIMTVVMSCFARSGHESDCERCGYKHRYKHLEAVIVELQEAVSLTAWRELPPALTDEVMGIVERRQP